ncbi:hypothetical protein AB0758_33055 [Tolypothrix bouteillei VB521301_2]|uniref:Co-chaperone DjlA N-terminal domain-containing protein n=1 Tax=Tolypothrix bouteillei VB521301 TaxID=1479485 RepID=A0A0C1NG31_9CYAN|nr:hypothetical protein [Tolypothrix bouteillei]KAF3884078.1 hypothetical protein DA73_0400000095 [Tolypothrix bouteillei VB521301]
MDSDLKKIVYSWIYKERWGFNTVPPTEEIAAYSKALAICAKGNGTLSQAEREWIIGYVATTGGDANLIELLKTYEGNDNLEELASTVEAGKRCLVYDAIAACCADKDFDDSERSKVKLIAETLGISQEIVEQIEDLYHEERKLFEKRMNLLFPDKKPY